MRGYKQFAISKIAKEIDIHIIITLLMLIASVRQPLCYSSSSNGPYFLSHLPEATLKDIFCPVCSVCLKPPSPLLTTRELLSGAISFY